MWQCRAMLNYRPLFIQKLDVRLPGLRVLRLRLNRHLPGVDTLGAHAHPFSQTLCYLSGRGRLGVGARHHDIFPGAVALLPAGVKHGFHETTGRRPLALAVDFELRGARRAGFRMERLSEEDAVRIRRYVSRLAGLRNLNSEGLRLVAASAALSILDIQLRALKWLPSRRPALPGFVKKFQELASRPAHAASGIRDLAHKTGLQPDYLNRRFRQATGLTLSQQRNAIRIEKARKLLARGDSVANAATGAGFADPNYFARWFKRQTGVPPSQLRHQTGATRSG